MKSFHLNHIPSLVLGKWLQRPGAETIEMPLVGVGIDSREDLAGRGFVAIRGDRHDGHDYLQEAVQSGARLLIVEREVPSFDSETCRHSHGVLLVDNTRAALARLALAYRRELTKTKVIAITGSSGKTTTKRLIDSILSRQRSGTCAPRSFNNEIGVPLTILAARPSDDYLVIEIGTNAPGEIESLARIAEPNVAVITSIGRAHLEGLGSISGVAQEKAAILRHVRMDGVAIVTADAPQLREYIHHAPSVVYFGEHEDSNLRLTGRGQEDGQWWFEVNGSQRYRIALPGKYNALNAIAAIAVAQQIGVHDDAISHGLKIVQAEAMRMCHVRMRDMDIYNDAYNANPEAMAAALDAFLEKAQDVPRRVVILGDMLELGSDSASIHEDVGRQLINIDKCVPIDLAVLIGEHMAHAARVLASAWSSDRVLAVQQLSSDTMPMVLAHLRPGDAVLLKGSRGMALERIVDKLSTVASERSEAVQG